MRVRRNSANTTIQKIRSPCFPLPVIVRESSTGLWNSEPPKPLGSMNECHDENVFVRNLVDKSIRVHEQLSNGHVCKFRNNLSAFCEIGKRVGRFMGLLDQGCSLEF